MSQPPSLGHETELASQGYDLIAGIDEAGRGALAGPVVASAVILPRLPNLPWFELVRDSKELNSTKRESLFDMITKEALAVGIGIVPPQVIDSINIFMATKLAMMQAVEKLPRQPNFLLIDRLSLSQCPIPQRGITRGDKTCLSIACASIMAKVTRDHIMEALDQVYPGYGFAQHKGYGTGSHISCLQKLGPSPIHRLYFAPVRSIIASRGAGPLATGHSEPFASFHAKSFAQCHSEPSAPFYTEPPTPCQSESSTQCHTEGVPMGSGPPKNLIQGKLPEGTADGPSRSR